MTVKLPAELAQRLRLHCAAAGRPANEVILDALTRFLATAEAPPLSAYAAGQGLFGRFSGPANLARDHKAACAQALESKHSRPVVAPANAANTATVAAVVITAGTPTRLMAKALPRRPPKPL